MAGIKQTIPSYGIGGISEQPDELKFPGQVRDVVNAIPSAVYGLKKRPGAMRVADDPNYPHDRLFSLQDTQAGTSNGQTKSASNRLEVLNHVPNQGKWFHYYRDEDEGSYIGQIDPDGFVRVWSCKDGIEKKVWYHAQGDGLSDTSAKGRNQADNADVNIGLLNSHGNMSNYDATCKEHTMIASITAPAREGAAAVDVRPDSNAWVSVDNNLRYLSGWVKQANGEYHYKHENIQTLSINDTTFVSNKNVAVRVGNQSAYTADEYHWAYIELLRTENGRQYAYNISDNNDKNTTITTVTGIKIFEDDLSEGTKTGHCPGIGTQVWGPIDSDDFPYEKTADGTTLLTDNGPDYKDIVQIKIKGSNSGTTTGASAASGHIYNNDQKYNETKNANGAEWNDGFHEHGSIIGPYTEAKYPTEKRRNLYFRITTNGQQGRVSTIDNQESKPDNFECSYNRELNLLFGGEGYQKGDRIRVQMSSSKGGRRSDDGSGNDNFEYSHPGRYIVEVINTQEIKCKANIRAVRPTPTPFDSDTAVTAESILAGMIQTNGSHEMVYPVYTSSGGDASNAPTLTTTSTTIKAGGEPIKAQIIGNGIYFFCNKKFDIEIPEKDLMRVTTGEVKGVGDLPLQCRHGAIVKVINAENADEDDYYMKFHGTNGIDGSGVWKECVAPSIKYHGSNAQYADGSSSGEPYTDLRHISPTAVTWPHVIQRQSNGDFLVKKFEWMDREVGDHITNPFPSFVSTEGNGSYPSMRNWYSDNTLASYPTYYQESTAKFITKVVFFRNRLVFLSGENVICSRPGTMDKPNFWSNTALTVSAVDPIDIAASSQYPSDLYDAIEVPAGLLVFSSNSQFLLESDDASFTTSTAKLRNISNYNYNTFVPPVSLGTSVGFLDNSNKFSRFSQLESIQREAEAVQRDITLLVPTLLNKFQNLLCNSRENRLVFIGKRPDIGNLNTAAGSTLTGGYYNIYGYKYETGIEDRPNISWFKWTFKNWLKYMFVVDDDLFFIDTDNFLQKINLVEDDEDLSVNNDRTSNVNYPLHIDNWCDVDINGVYSPTTNITTFTNFGALAKVTGGTTDLVIVDMTHGLWDTCTVFDGGSDGNLNDFTVPGNWSEQINIIDVTNEGSGYTSPPAVTFSGGGGTGATATAVLTGDKVTSVTITDGGRNYTSAPTVAIAGAATATCTIGPSKKLGYMFEFSIDLPTIYPVTPVGGGIKADVNGNLTVHRVNFNFGKVGTYETTLTRIGKTPYTDIYESTPSDSYLVSSAPFLESDTRTVPIYERNKNVKITLKSKYPSPATLNSMTWEGDFSTRNYRRV